MNKHHALLSLPSSGSDWLAGCIARGTGWPYYEKEFFNPICNPMPAIDGFGCELVSAFERIARPLPSDAAWDQWQSSGFTFDKEVYAAFNVPWFASRFKCAVLLRSIEETFPPKRLRVMAWYDAIWNSCQAAGYRLQAVTLNERAHEAHAIASAELRRQAVANRLPVLNYRDLCTASHARLIELLGEWGEGHGQGIATQIIATREPRLPTTQVCRAAGSTGNLNS